jgi:hypothetical protein
MRNALGRCKLGLLDRVLRLSGGVDLWRRIRFTVHMSIRGALIAARCAGVELLGFVMERDIREPAPEIINNSKPSLSASCARQSFATLMALFSSIEGRPR